MAAVKTKRAVSAGGVIFRRNRGTEVAITARKGAKGVWALPKGTVEQGETLEQTAVREVAEETGLTGRPIEKIDVIDYWFVLEGVRYHKYVHFFLLEFETGKPRADDWEIAAVEWAPIGEAVKRLTFKGERSVLEKAAHILGEDGERLG
ncbi:MAG: NUDIX hydrolase [Candidatus Aquicultorales bacterium]